MVNAREHDLLPGTLFDWRTDLDDEAKIPLLPELAQVLIRLVGQGFVEVRSLVRDRDDYDVVAGAELAQILADPAVWFYSDYSWTSRDEGLAIVLTPLGRDLTRTDHNGVPDPQSSNPHLRKQD